MRSILKEKFLLFRIRAKKDPDAFGQIYDAYVKPIYRFIYFKVPSTEQAEDLTSETFLKAWQYLKENREVQSLQALLYSVARSTVIDHYRKAQTELPLEDDRGNILTDVGSEKLLKDIETSHDAEQVIAKLRGLKDEYREVIVLKYLDELSANEIAATLGKSAANVRVLLHRAMRALADAINHESQNAQKNPHPDS
ncbi:RNA polymerase sigma factor [Candidatus Uhrbacteria bacterium]|nr:RNA polymerase sigma factor [Candidatus Uhrbacteria bacterium]